MMDMPLDQKKFPAEIKIENISVGKNHPPFIIAEVSGNHQHSLDRALEIIRSMKGSGVQAVKFQTYTADGLTLNSKKPDFVISDKESLWRDRNLYELYQEAYTPWEWHKQLFDEVRANGMIPFSSAFDESAVDFLESLECPCYKIASFENGHLELIRKAMQTGKPVIVSTGMATESMIQDILQVSRETGNQQLILLKCTSSYPAKAKFSNLLTIPDMEKKFRVLIGLSDHTLGIGCSVGAVALGACVIEKHVTLARNDGGVDSQFSMEPEEMRALLRESQIAWESRGEVFYGPTESEKNSVKFRRSIYFCKDLEKGHVLTRQDVRIIRPGYGLEPKVLSQILGKKLKQNVTTGDRTTYDVFDGI